MDLEKFQAHLLMIGFERDSNGAVPHLRGSSQDYDYFIDGMLIGYVRVAAVGFADKEHGGVSPEERVRFYWTDALEPIDRYRTNDLRFQVISDSLTLSARCTKVIEALTGLINEVTTTDT